MMGLNFVSVNLVTLLYLIASVCFIQALKGLSNPKSARAGNVFGMVGMAIAIVTTVVLILKQSAGLGSNLGLGLGLLFAALVVGGAVGCARRRHRDHYRCVAVDEAVSGTAAYPFART